MKGETMHSIVYQGYFLGTDEPDSLRRVDMKVRDAVKQLTELDQDSDIVLAWWEHDMFPEVKADNWADVAEMLEDRMEWSYPHEQMADLIADRNPTTGENT